MLRFRIENETFKKTNDIDTIQLFEVLIDRMLADENDDMLSQLDEMKMTCFHQKTDVQSVAIFCF